jgi:hypothetical protein
MVLPPMFEDRSSRAPSGRAPAAARPLRARVEDVSIEAVASPGDPAWDVRAPARTGVVPGVTVGGRAALEVSLGALADEIVVEGVVQTTEADAVVLRVEEGLATRVRYLLEVQAGLRHATARRAMRVTCDLPVRWVLDGRGRRTRLGDLSRGGAFLLSADAPQVGACVEIELQHPQGPLRLESTVSWVRHGNAPGFGVCFRLRDRDLANRLTEVLRDAHAAPDAAP